MKMQIYQDPRLRSVKWKDLIELSSKKIFFELTLSLPWLLLSLFSAGYHLIIPALLFSFIFFLTGLRQVHNAYHYALGISQRSTEWFIYLLSVLMLGSMHAVKYNHLQHHKHCLGEGDIEGMSARMKWWKAFLFGPLFPFMLHYNALKNGNNNTKKWIVFELFSIIIFSGAVFYLFDIYALKYHVIAMIIGESMTAFFAVWTVHHDCDNNYFIARTMRGKFKSAISYNMFYHVEHHLFPKVPTCNLPKLAERLDANLPDLKNMKVF